VNGAEYPITLSDVRQWEQLYPAVDVMQQLRNMLGWLLANPKNRKTKSGIIRFVNGWLTQEQNRAPAQPASASSANVGVRHTPEPEPVPRVTLPADLDKNKGREAWKAIADTVEVQINPHSFDTWIRPLRSLGVSGATLYIQIPTKEFSHVGDKYGDIIEPACERLGLSGVRFLPSAAIDRVEAIQ